MANAGNNSLVNPSPFDSEYDRCLKLIVEIEKISRFLKQYFAASELSNSLEDLRLMTYTIEHALKASMEAEVEANGSLLN